MKINIKTYDEQIRRKDKLPYMEPIFLPRLLYKCAGGGRNGMKGLLSDKQQIKINEGKFFHQLKLI